MNERAERRKIAEMLKSDTATITDKIEKLAARAKSLERELEAAKAKLASSASNDLVKNARTTAKGIKVIAEMVDVSDTETLRTMVDRLRLALGSGVVALAGVQGEKAMLVIGVTQDLIKTAHAGNLVKEGARIGGGKGGGRPDFAQAGGVETAKLQDVFNGILKLLE